MKQLSYSDISIVPQKCIVESRKECDTSISFGGRTFEMPVYPSNMKSVVDINTCKFLARKNWFYTMHRFGIKSIFDFISEMNEENLFTSISVGINEDSYIDLETIYQEPLTIDYITIDVANAWSEKCKKMVDFIKNKFPESFLIVGNVATGEAVKEISEWGVGGIKVGISQGAACTTKNKTGVGRPMVSTILDCCSNVCDDTLIIADGGIKEHGDIAKALASGADMVMSGFLFSGYDQSAGGVMEFDNKLYKEYFGSASKYNKGIVRNIEGKKMLIQYRGDMEFLLEELKEDLQSSISYSGGNKLKDLRMAKTYLI